jgi:hypothetical protein
MKRQVLVTLCSAALVSLVMAFPAAAQQKTAKQCEDEWKTNKAEIQAKKQKKKDFIAECRGQTAATTTAPAAAPAPAPAPAAPPPKATAAPKAPAARTTGTPSAANQYASEGDAKSHCFSDTVVWVNLDSKVYHYAGNKSYGTTKKGAYMCEKDTASEGYRAAKNEKHP